MTGGRRDSLLPRRFTVCGSMSWKRRRTAVMQRNGKYRRERIWTAATVAGKTEEM